MTIMKRYLYMILATLPMLLLSCTEEYTPGEPDVTDCYGVWFPEQDFEEKIMFDSKEKNTVITVKLARTRKDGRITVPVRIVSGQKDYMSLNADSNTEDDIFEVIFEDGQTDAELSVLFMSEELGYESRCELEISDPKYAKIYGANSLSVSFEAMVVDWKRVFKGADNTAGFRNDVFYYLYGAYMITSFDVELYERTDKPGYYKANGIFSYESMSYMLYGSSSMSSEIKKGGYTRNASIFIDASDKDKIYIPYQNTGVTLSASEGPIWIGSYVPENGYETAENNYAKLSEDGGTYIFPSVVMALPEVGFESINTNENLALILPGYEVYDYSLYYMVPGESDEGGKLPVELLLGEHVKNVRMQLFEGVIPEEEVEEHLADVHKATDNVFELSTSNLEVKDGYYEAEAKISAEKSGEYTLIALTYGDDSEKYQDYSYTTLTYRAAGDKYPVNCTAGLIVSDKYAGMDLTAKNSVEYYIQGKNLTSVKLGFFRRDSYEGAPKLMENAVKNSSSVDKATLNAINNGGYVNISTADSGSDYVMVVVASNGYESNTIVEYASTEGKLLPQQANWSVWDAYGYNGKNPFVGANKNNFFGDWEMWALDLQDTLAVRKKIGVVNIADEPNSTTPDTSLEGIEMDAIRLSGLFSGSDYDKYGIDPVLHWNYATMKQLGGVILSGKADFDNVRDKNDVAYHASLAYLCSNGYLYARDYFMMGVFVADGIIAFVDSGIASQMGVYGECFGWMLAMYADKSRGEFVDSLLTLGYVILIDPKKYDLTEGADTKMQAVDRKQLSNYIEIANSVSVPDCSVYNPDGTGEPKPERFKVTGPVNVEGFKADQMNRPVSFEAELSPSNGRVSVSDKVFELRR